MVTSLFVRLISHQPAVLFSQNKPANCTFLSQKISTSHQPNEQAEHQRHAATARLSDSDTIGKDSEFMCLALIRIGSLTDRQQQGRLHIIPPRIFLQ
jgi:hypothetical protein